MGMSAQGRRSGGSRRGGRGGRKQLLSEINVTPFVDVMLVLLIIFMVAAPLLTVGVPIDLPETEAKALNSETQPITVSVNSSGQVFLQETEIPIDEVVANVKASDALFSELLGKLDERRMAELTLIIGFYMAVSRFLENFEIEIEPARR